MKARSKGNSIKAARKQAEKKAVKRPEKKAGKRSQKACQNCDKDLSKADKALFVEEEVGRVFCSEECIAHYFTPAIEKLETEYHRLAQSVDAQNEFRTEDYEALSHLRWLTLEEPDEIRRRKNRDGDWIYTLISEFQPGGRSVWCICICLLLRGEPSFLFISFPTASLSLVQLYRKGEIVAKEEIAAAAAASKDSEEQTDRLAGEWTPDETLRAQYPTVRGTSDIPRGEFAGYQECLQETLDHPNEVWSIEFKQNKKLYHFIRHYPGSSAFWYVIIARDTEEEDQLEILDAFPTRDRALMKAYQTGLQEVGGADDEDNPLAGGGSARVLH